MNLPSHANPLLADQAAPVVDPEAIRRAHVVLVRERYRDLRDARRKTTATQAIAGLHLDGREIYGLTRGQFSFIDLIEAILATTGPARLDLCTWTATGPHIARAVEAYRDGRITAARWLVDVSFTRRCPQEAAAIRSAFGLDAIRVTQTHAKFAVIHNATWKVACRTSMNLNVNPRLEHFTVAHDPALADFLLAAMDDCWKTQPQALADQRVKTVSKWWAKHG
jgi:hypothetical protein